MKFRVLTALLLASTAAALAQPVMQQTEFETVYSDAQRERDQDLSRRFVQGVLAPSASFEDQYAKWKSPVCPNVYGMSAASKFLIERRIREVAHEVGAPVNRADPCTPNITIIVTPEPQATLDSIAAAAPFLVVGGKKRQLTVTHPIQSWYTTFRRDYSGLVQLDLAWEDAATAAAGAPAGVAPLSTDASIGVAEAGNTSGIAGMSAGVTGSLEQDIPRVRAQGGRLSTGVSPEMAGVVVIVDSKAIMGMTLGTLGDYFALLALAPSPVTGHCQVAPSITNLMANCATDVKTNSLSVVDLALLTGLYQTPEKPEMIQKARIIGNMRRSLEAHFGH
jgi:hypothetical protein